MKKNEKKPKLVLMGKDGNVYNILGLARQASKKAGWNNEKWTAFQKDFMSGDYDHALQVCMEHFDVH